MLQWLSRTSFRIWFLCALKFSNVVSPCRPLLVLQGRLVKLYHLHKYNALVKCILLELSAESASPRWQCRFPSRCQVSNSISMIIVGLTQWKLFLLINMVLMLLGNDSLKYGHLFQSISSFLIFVSVASAAIRHADLLLYYPFATNPRFQRLLLCPFIVAALGEESHAVRSTQYWDIAWSG